MVNIMINKLRPYFWKNLSMGRKFVLLFVAVMMVVTFNASKIMFKIYELVNGVEYTPSTEFARMVNSVTNVPFSTKPEYRNDSPDITRLAQEEWFSLPYVDNTMEIDLLENEDNLAELMPTIEDAQHGLSLENTPAFWFANKKEIYKNLCSNLFFCDVMPLLVQNYALEQPVILENILKIAKRPCDYIRTIDEVKPINEVAFYSDFGFRGHKFAPIQYKKKAIEARIVRARANLFCEKKNFWKGGGFKSLPIFSKKFVLIMVDEKREVRGENSKTFDIIVTREDI